MEPETTTNSGMMTLPMARVMGEGVLCEDSRVTQVTYTATEYGGNTVRLDRKAMLELVDIQSTHYLRMALTKNQNGVPLNEVEMSALEVLMFDLGLIDLENSETSATLLRTFLLGYFLSQLKINAEVLFERPPEGNFLGDS